MDTIFECKSLYKNFGNIKALSDVSFSIQPGRIVGLLGPNGSGKTTLIKLANGLLIPSKGTVLIKGLQPGIETKKIVSYLPEKTYLNELLTVKEQIRFFTDFYSNFNKEKAYLMLEKLDISLDSKVKFLSKGTKEKVQLILVMSRDANLYLLDEPIGGVDPAARDYILNTIISNYNKNASIIISTHLIADIENILDDVIFISKGKIVLKSSVDEIREKKHMTVDRLFREEFKC